MAQNLSVRFLLALLCAILKVSSDGDYGKVGTLAHEHNEVNRNSGLCIVLLHSLFKLWFLIISLRSLRAFQVVHLLGNSDLQVLMLVFGGSKLHFYKAVKLHLRHKQHELHMLFWQAGLLLQCNTDHSEVFLSLCCPIMRRSNTTALKSKMWCSLLRGSRASVPVRRKNSSTVLLPNLSEQAANSCFEIPSLHSAMFNIRY